MISREDPGRSRRLRRIALLTALALRPEDLPVFGGGVLSLVLLAALAGLYRIILHPDDPGSGLARALREHLRAPALAVVFLVPALNACLWVPALDSHVGDALHLLGATVAVLLVEALLVYLFAGLLPARGVQVGESVALACRWVVYPVLGLVVLGQILAAAEVQSHLLSAGVWVLLVLAMLHTLYRYFFKTAPLRHPLAVALRRRLRLWAYLLVLLLTFTYATTYFPSFPFEDQMMLAGLALGLVLLMETLLVLVFEFYFPVLKQATVPNLFQDLTRALAYAGLVLLALGVVFKQNLGSLLVGSTVLSVILGLALQETLGNFFAGLALGISKPYSLGDHIQIGGLSGKVEKIDWRSTALWTSTGDYTVLPNSVLAKENILNYSAPSKLHARLVDVGAHYRHPPHEVRRVMLEAARSVPDVLSDPAPEVWLMEFADSSMNFRLRYWMQDYGHRFQIDSNVREAIWYHFARASIEIPFPIRTMVSAPDGPPADQAKSVHLLLEKVDFLRALSPTEQQMLVDRTRLLVYAPGEKVFAQGDPGESFYLIKTGRLRVTVCNQEGECFLAKEMLPGEFFGEMALLTGEPRSATVETLTDVELLSLDKSALRELLRANPDADRLISEVLARRQLRTDQARQEQASEKARKAAERRGGPTGQVFEQLSEQFLKKIREFFSY